MAVVLPITVSNKLSLSLSTVCFGDFGEMAFERREKICGGNCVREPKSLRRVSAPVKFSGMMAFFFPMWIQNLEFRGLEGIQGII